MKKQSIDRRGPGYDHAGMTDRVVFFYDDSEMPYRCLHPRYAGLDAVVPAFPRDSAGRARRILSDGRPRGARAEAAGARGGAAGLGGGAAL